ncbi:MULTISPECIES: ABC transporter ATP-binding protein [Clostridium]|jgi:ABC-2 type transport system ATP-binding protein|uniref:ABC transporter ATP-binding protein n=1 Tax=Clostridium TaxID=1485 RepID=UPI0011599C24|nr:MULTISPECIES: ABC transporter ATP-binding protein [Clostridium]MBS5308233.1 ABC transporter ATP-binding protein [Clostridium sp.]MBS6501070.1 ABC transporter ATP-binding protein [Clostridium sp.]MDB1941384.1 ABC transporter ATP-binding protein [Clostridium tertium]MDB1944611.1 ABC transporter ATP-binding protein [Clostridium tertium]MDB1951878.1 ABC transporter ATP-binding protein [Clostridium tertium]
MIELKNYSLNYGDSKILDNISFSLDRGKILGIVGPSGVGKTSLIRGIVGIYKGTSGSLIFDGEDVYDNPEVKRKIAFVPDEHSSFYLITLKEILNYYKSIYSNFDEDKFYKINKIFKIPLNKRFLQLSKGMKMRVNLMIAFSLNCELLVLDEPTSGLDPILKEKVLKIIMNEVYSKEKSVIISSHNLGELERICDEILILNEGKIEYHNSLENIKRNIKKIQVAFDMPVYEEDLNIDGIFSISQVGRVFTIITESYDDDLKEKLNKFNPLFIEEIDLSLEEVFIHRLEGECDYEEIFE